VAVTGGSGLIGRATLDELIANGAVVRALARERQPQGKVEIVQGDVLDAASRQRLLKGTGWLVHMANLAHSSLDTAEERQRAYALNVTATLDLLREAKAAGVRRAVYISSAHVYAGQQGTDLRETSATAADSGYAGMKIEAEREALAMSSPEFDVVVLRPCLTYGPGVQFNLHSLMRALSRGYYVHPQGADAVRSMLSVRAAGAAITHCLNEEVVAGGVYNVADRQPVSLRAWVDDLADALGARRPKALPVAMLRAVAAFGTLAKKAGLPAPITRDSLRKLTTDFSLNTDKLAATGFAWPSDEAAVVHAMAAAYRAEERSI
jgi:nucleoside-diphosphate-sugar epimerase